LAFLVLEVSVRVTTRLWAVFFPTFVVLLSPDPPRK
jgi:hypothetical protein